MEFGLVVIEKTSKISTGVAANMRRSGKEAHDGWMNDIGYRSCLACVRNANPESHEYHFPQSLPNETLILNLPLSAKMVGE